MIFWLIDIDEMLPHSSLSGMLINLTSFLQSPT